MSILPDHVFAVAKRDFLDVYRSRIAWLPVAVYTVAMVGLWLLNPVEDFNQALMVIAGLSGILLIPLVALIAAYLSIAGERESGSIKFTLGQPVSRLALVLGKLASRSVVVLFGLVVSFLVSLAASRFLLAGISFDYTSYVLFSGFTLLYAIVYVSIGVGVSAATSSRAQAIGGALTVFVSLNVLWDSAAGPAALLKSGLRQIGRNPEQFETITAFITILGPTSSYLQGVTLILERQSLAMDEVTHWFHQGWFVIVLLVTWVVLPVAFGYWRFRNADIG